ncbi:CBS domain-containing protein [Kribbella sp. NPDC054772]
MLVREAMTTPAVTVTTQSSTEVAAGLMRDEQLGSLPVVDRRGGLVGVIRRADLTRGAARADVSRRQGVGDTMCHRVITVGPDDEIELALDRMCSGLVEDLPVVDHGRVVGTVCRRNLAGLLSAPCQPCEVEFSSGTARDADAEQAALPVRPLAREPAAT